MSNVTPLGPRLVNVTPSRTYATAENAVKAVLKVFPADRAANSDLNYMLLTDKDGRFYPVFIGERACNAGAHFHFCVVM